MRATSFYLFLLFAILLIASACSTTVSLSNPGHRWIDWDDLSVVEGGITLDETKIICGEPLLSEYIEDKQVYSIFYSYRTKKYKIEESRRNISVPYNNVPYNNVYVTRGANTPQYQKASDIVINHNSVELIIRMNFKYDSSKNAYILKDWIYDNAMKDALFE